MQKKWLTVGLVSMALVGMAGSSVRAEEKGKKPEEKEVKMSFEDVPSAVRKTLKREAAGAKITTVDKEMKDGKLIYEADVEIDGTNYEIIVDMKGKLLSKVIDEEAEADAGDKKSKAKEGDKEETKPKMKAESKSARDEVEEKSSKREKAENKEEGAKKTKLSKKPEMEDVKEKPGKAEKSDKNEDAEKKSKMSKKSEKEDDDNDKPAKKEKSGKKEKDNDEK